MSKIRNGGIGVIEEGKLKGRHFIIPSEVLVQKDKIATFGEFSPACLIHQKFIPSSGCPECKEEIEAQEKANKDIGL